ncbi:membrane protein [Endozoicomonas elysicola]|uniref:Membrane protein n=1 Tax=Endozoicomonas elysicola TaxID=305900 RepID=A0A081K852_9GAMM|nr:membrane protein [Endozoicomonas elysicola]KEI70328.1 membrane protein [Endozoicomonas elysicola]
MRIKLLPVLMASLTSMSVAADVLSNPQIGVVLDGRFEEGDGFSLGHTELSMSANIDDKFHGVLTSVIETHDDDTEFLLEEAFIETIALPNGFNVRAGRFLSNFGYMNNQHMHTDNFTTRPGIYRDYLGTHYYDDGLRASIVLPTDLYIRLSAEAFSGDKMSALEHAEDQNSVGVYTAAMKMGGDISESSSWQFGLSYLHNKNGTADHFEESDHSHDGHDHSHDARKTGKHLYGTDFVWKWAPDGNYKYRNLTLAAEYMLLDGVVDNKFKDEDHAPDKLSGYYLSGVYRFSPSWSAGIRYGEVETYDGHAHGDHVHFTDQKEKEATAMVAWNSSHFGTIRAQFSRTEDQDKEKDNVFMLQYVMSFGAHGAHAF